MSLGATKRAGGGSRPPDDQSDGGAAAAHRAALAGPPLSLQQHTFPSPCLGHPTRLSFRPTHCSLNVIPTRSLHGCRPHAQSVQLLLCFFERSLAGTGQGGGPQWLVTSDLSPAVAVVIAVRQPLPIGRWQRHPGQRAILAVELAGNPSVVVLNQDSHGTSRCFGVLVCM